MMPQSFSLTVTERDVWCKVLITVIVSIEYTCMFGYLSLCFLLQISHLKFIFTYTLSVFNALDSVAEPVRFDYPLTKFGNYGFYIAAMEADGTCPTFRIITEEEEVTKSQTSSPVVAPASSLIPITSSPTKTISLLGEGKYQTLSPTTRGINPIFSKSGKGSKAPRVCHCYCLMK